MRKLMALVIGLSIGYGGSVVSMNAQEPPEYIGYCSTCGSESEPCCVYSAICEESGEIKCCNEVDDCAEL